MKELLAKAVVDENIEEMKKACALLKEKGVVPTMNVILVGNNPASATYVRNKKKFIEKIGGICEITALSEEMSEKDFLATLKKISDDKKIHGLFVQLPLPKHLNHLPLSQIIPPEKDVDGFTESNLMLILEGDTGTKALAPCTPKGIITLLKAQKIELAGKNVVIIGRSLIVGKPLALLFLNENATVTVCHSRTKNLEEHTKRADIIVAAIGKERFLKENHLGKDQIIIDVGINYDSNNKICGDVDFENVKDKCAFITPVPGGVGPMTILTLAQNLLQAARKIV